MLDKQLSGLLQIKDIYVCDYLRHGFGLVALYSHPFLMDSILLWVMTVAIAIYIDIPCEACGTIQITPVVN